jgi:flagellar assembly factor FliW
MRFQTSRFGEIEVADDRLITFPEGILGFPTFHRYALLENAKGGPFRWLQSMDDGSLAFVVADPWVFFSDYRVNARAEDLEPIKLSNVEMTGVLVIMTIRRDAGEITANLQGPLVMNAEARLGRQLVLNDPGLTPHHKILVGAK